MTHNRLRKLALGAVFAATWFVLGGVSPVSGQTSQARIAVFTPGINYDPVYKGLQEGLARLGYKEGQNITYILEDTKGSTADLALRVKKLLSVKPDALFTVATIHTIAAKQATTTVPIVFAWLGDPVEAGLVASFASSKNNVTGVTSLTPNLIGKRLELQLELAPKAKRVLAIVTANEVIAQSSWRHLEEISKKLGVQLIRRDVIDREGIMRTLKETPRGSVDAIFYLSSILMKANMDIVIQKAKADKLPLSVTEDSLVEQGSLFSYGPTTRLVGQQAAVLVDKVLKGTKPSDIVIETPNRYYLAVNLATAKEIGIKIPKSILERADRLIE